jgi:hypothetical protein
MILEQNATSHYKITTQYADGSLIEPEGILSKWQNDCDVVAREKCNIIWF